MPESIYTELGTTGLSRWGGAVTEEPLVELQGAAGWRLYRQMRLNHPVVNAVLFAIENSIRQARWYVEPASTRDEDREAAEFLESCMRDMSFTWDQTLQFILSFLVYGFSIVELIYKKRLGLRPPRYARLKDPAPSNYADGRIGWRKWAPRPPLSLAPTPWIFDEAGGIQGIVQCAPPDYRERRIPIKRLTIFRTTVGSDNNPEGLSLLRGMYIPWYFASNLREIEGIGFERDLAGIPIIYLGRDCTISGPNSDYELAKELGRNLRRDDQECVVIPKPKMGLDAEGRGMLVELLGKGAGSRQHRDIGQAISRYERQMAMTVLCQFVFLGMERVGSYALAKRQTDFFSLAVGGWARSIAETINRHAVTRLFGYNSFRIRELPRICVSETGIPNLEDMAKFVNQLVAADVLRPDDILENYLRRLAGMPPAVKLRRPSRDRVDRERQAVVRDQPDVEEEPPEDVDRTQGGQ